MLLGALLGAARAAHAADVRLVYPPDASLVSESPVTLLGYVVGAPVNSLEAKVVGSEGTAAPLREELYLYKGKVFSGSLPLAPGRNNVVVGDTVLNLLYRPDFEGDRDGEFRRPLAHGGGIESCGPCHGFARGELTLKSRPPGLCVGCHEVGTESLRAVLKDNHHTREITPYCVSCHDPHAAFEPHLLRAAAGGCEACHPDQANPSRHETAAGGCVACHDPHASSYPAMLRGEALALCRDCHGDLANPSRYPRSYHRPVERGTCFDCHEPHAGTTPALLQASAPDLCWKCHPRTGGVHEDELDECSGCHDGHLSGQRRLLRPEASGVCTECHGDFPEGRSNHPALKEGCVACHDPHKPDPAAESRAVCGRCHNLGDVQFGSAHGRLTMTSVRQCVFCHKPHSSEYPHLLRGDLHYPLSNGGCTTCHEQRARDVVLRYEGSQNCTRCHGNMVGMSTIVEMDKVHKPVFQIDCIACHNPHMGVRDALLLEEPVTLCGWCHGILLRGVENVHGVFDGGGTCYTCHVPHISEYLPLLKQPQPDLCVKCHLDAVGSGGAAERQDLHGALRPGQPCTGCHNPHGTNTETLLKDTPDALCRECHRDMTRGAGEPYRYLHGPVGAGNCTACHQLGHRHAAVGDAFLRGRGSAVCALCHDTGSGHVPARYQAKMRELGNDCLVCHGPHGAENPFLLRSGL